MLKVTNQSMSEKIDVPSDLSGDIEAAVQKIAKHTGYTRDEVIEKVMEATLEMADAPSDRIEIPDFILIIKKALKDSGPGS
jgi:hypothetical protein